MSLLSFLGFGNNKPFSSRKIRQGNKSVSISDLKNAGYKSDGIVSGQTKGYQSWYNELHHHSVLYDSEKGVVVECKNGSYVQHISREHKELLAGRGVIQVHNQKP